MFKNNWSNKIFTGRKAVSYRQNQPVISHGNSKASQDFLSNIVEEGSMEDLPKTFEQEEQYMNDCLNSIGSSVEDVRNNELEEYDFDDFNSIASTTSMLNLTADYDERIKSPPLSRSSHVQPIRSTPIGYNSPRNTPGQTNGFSKLNGTERLNNYQKSLSRVQNWDRLGKGGGQEDWSQVLIQAAEAGDLITVQDAVSHLGATKESLITARDATGNTPLHKAAQFGKLQCLKWLVKRAPPEAVTIGNHANMTPAAMATQYGQIECLEWLVDQTHAKQELDKENSFTLLHYAAKEGQEECLRYLLSYISQSINIADICDSYGVTPAHLAAREGHLECLQTLVEFNSDVTLKDREGCTPADCAFKAGHTGCGKYLVVVETCVDLSARLASCSKENEELRNRLRVLESYPHVHMPDRPEAVGGDQSDSSSTVSMDSIIYPGNKPTKFVDTRSRSSSVPDGESPKGTKKEGTAYEFQANGHLAPNPTPSKTKACDHRRGSFPLACWEKSTKDDITNHQGKSFKTSDRSHTSGSSSASTRNELTVITRSPPRTPNCPTPSPGSTRKSKSHPRVHFKESSPHGEKASSKHSSSPASTSVSSSRSQSPFRSDRSTGSSTETVLLATPLVGHYQSPHRDSRIHDRVQNDSVGLHPKKRSGHDYDSHEKDISKQRVTNVINHGRSTKENINNERVLRSRLTSDGLLKIPDSTNHRARLSWHGQEADENVTQHVHSTANHNRPPNNNRKLNDFELLLVDNSANQNGRLSWHGLSREDRLSPHEHFTPAPMRSSSRSPIRKAQVTWGDQNVHGRDPSPRNKYHIGTPTEDNVFLGSSFTSSEERPWYETEEVEL